MQPDTTDLQTPGVFRDRRTWKQRRDWSPRQAPPCNHPQSGPRREDVPGGVRWRSTALEPECAALTPLCRASAARPWPACVCGSVFSSINTTYPRGLLLGFSELIREKKSNEAPTQRRHAGTTAHFQYLGCRQYRMVGYMTLRISPEIH